jgi:hypothetical protein
MLALGSSQSWVLVEAQMGCRCAMRSFGELVLLVALLTVRAEQRVCSLGGRRSWRCVSEQQTGIKGMERGLRTRSHADVTSRSRFRDFSSLSKRHGMSIQTSRRMPIGDGSIFDDLRFRYVFLQSITYRMWLSSCSYLLVVSQELQR